MVWTFFGVPASISFLHSTKKTFDAKIVHYTNWGIIRRGNEEGNFN